MHAPRMTVSQYGWGVLDAYVTRYLDNLAEQTLAGTLSPTAAAERGAGLQMWLDQVHDARRAGQMHPSWRWDLWYPVTKRRGRAGAGPEHRKGRLVILCARGPAEELGIHVPTGQTHGIAAAIPLRHLVLSDGSDVPSKATLTELLRQAETARAVDDAFAESLAAELHPDSGAA